MSDDEAGRAVATGDIGHFTRKLMRAGDAVRIVCTFDLDSGRRIEPDLVTVLQGVEDDTINGFPIGSKE